MYPSKVKGQILTDEDITQGSAPDDNESLSLMLERLQKDRFEAQNKQQRLKKFLYAFKLAAKQVRSVSARPGITPTEQELSGLSPMQQREMERARVLAAIDVIKQQLGDTTGLTASFIKRCKAMAQGDHPYDHGIDWDDPDFRSKLNEMVSSLVSDMWMERKEATYGGKFINFVEFTLREIKDRQMDDPPERDHLENFQADRFLILHKAFLDIDEALYTMHPANENSWYNEELYKLVFGTLAQGDSVLRTQAVMDTVITPLTEASCKNVIETLGAERPLTERDQAILYKAMLSHVSRDTAVVIRHEGRLFLNSLGQITPRQRKVYLKEQGAFIPWLLEREQHRLNEFYPAPSAFI